MQILLITWGWFLKLISQPRIPNLIFQSQHHFHRARYKYLLSCIFIIIYFCIRAIYHSRRWGRFTSWEQPNWKKNDWCLFEHYIEPVFGCPYWTEGRFLLPFISWSWYQFMPSKFKNSILIFSYLGSNVCSLSAPYDTSPCRVKIHLCLSPVSWAVFSIIFGILKEFSASYPWLSHCCRLPHLITVHIRNYCMFSCLIFQ